MFVRVADRDGPVFTHYGAKLLQGQPDHLVGWIRVADRQRLGLFEKIKKQKQREAAGTEQGKGISLKRGGKLTKAKVLIPFP